MDDELKEFDLLVTKKSYGMVTVKAHNLKEAKDIVRFDTDDEDIDWTDWDVEVEEDI